MTIVAQKEIEGIVLSFSAVLEGQAFVSFECYLYHALKSSFKILINVVYIKSFSRF